MGRQIQIIGIVAILLLLISVSLIPQPNWAEEEKEEKEKEDQHEHIEEEDEDIDLSELEELDLDDDDDSKTSSNAFSSTTIRAQKQGALVELTDRNVEKAAASHEFVLLLGYAPWCTQSSSVMPEFAAAAVELHERGSSALLAKIDASGQPRSASIYGIKGFPSLLFFTNGTLETYSGGLTRNEIVVWVRKRTGFPVTPISSKAEAEHILKQDAPIVVGYFEKFQGTEYEEFLASAKSETETEFIQVDDEEVAKTFNLGLQISPPYIILLKNEPETYVPFEESFNQESILWFVEVNKRPLVTRLDQYTAQKAYASPITHQVTVFSKAEEAEQLVSLVQDVAKKFKGKILFLFADTDNEELSRPILAVYGLEPEKPIVTAFNYVNGFKYYMEKELTSENLQDFSTHLLSGDLKQYYRSEPIPEKKEGNVQIVVGKTFDEIVLDSSKDVILEVLSPYCLKCDGVNKVFEAIGKHYKEVETLVVAKIDASANEHPLLQADDHPTVLFYPAGQKTAPVMAPKKWSVKDLVRFLHEHATFPLNPSHKSQKDEL